jgi:hypothetical protein
MGIRGRPPNRRIWRPARKHRRSLPEGARRSRPNTDVQSFRLCFAHRC